MLDCTTVRELAAAIDADVDVHRRDVEDDGEPIPLLPNAHWLFEHGDPRRLAQTEAIRLPRGVTRDALDAMLRSVIDGHAVLRSRLDRDTMTLVAHPVADVLSEVTVTGDMRATVVEQTSLAVDRLDPERGVMLDAVWLRASDGPADVLLLTPHVLAVDPSSWRIVLGELETAWHAVAAGRAPTPAREHTSLAYVGPAARRPCAQARDVRLLGAPTRKAPTRSSGRGASARTTDRVGDVVVTLSLADPDVTAEVLAGPVPVTEVLVAATARAITKWRRHRGQETPPPLLALETHGRADATVSAGMGDDADELDTGDTVGLLSAIYPMRIDAADAAGVGRPTRGDPR